MNKHERVFSQCTTPELIEMAREVAGLMKRANPATAALLREIAFRLEDACEMATVTPSAGPPHPGSPGIG